MNLHLALNRDGQDHYSEALVLLDLIVYVHVHIYT